VEIWQQAAFVKKKVYLSLHIKEAVPPAIWQQAAFVKKNA
jgi:hypothetical protein